jgi:DNA-binding MarR family transcriptional regulator
MYSISTYLYRQCPQITIEYDTDIISPGHDYLFDNGFVLRIKNKNDRREYKLHVTKKGSRAIPDIERIFNELAAISFKGLPSGKIADLYSMLYTIINNISCLKEETE